MDDNTEVCEECQETGFEYECSGPPDHTRKMVGKCPECDGMGYVDVEQEDT